MKTYKSTKRNHIQQSTSESHKNAYCNIQDNNKKACLGTSKSTGRRWWWWLVVIVALLVLMDEKDNLITLPLGRPKSFRLDITILSVLPDANVRVILKKRIEKDEEIVTSTHPKVCMCSVINFFFFLFQSLVLVTNLQLLTKWLFQ